MQAWRNTFLGLSDCLNMKLCVFWPFWISNHEWIIKIVNRISVSSNSSWNNVEHLFEISKKKHLKESEIKNEKQTTRREKERRRKKWETKILWIIHFDSKCKWNYSNLNILRSCWWLFTSLFYSNLFSFYRILSLVG